MVRCAISCEFLMLAYFGSISIVKPMNETLVGLLVAGPNLGLIAMATILAATTYTPFLIVYPRYHASSLYNERELWISY